MKKLRKGKVGIAAGKKYGLKYGLKDSSVTRETLLRVKDLLPVDGSYVRWSDLKNKCTGTKADPNEKMSLETLSQGLKGLIEIGDLIEKKSFRINNNVVMGYRRAMEENMDEEKYEEIARYKINLPEISDKLIRRYADLRIAKEWIAKLTGLSYDEVQEELDKLREAEHSVKVEETGEAFTLPLPSLRSKQEQQKMREEAERELKELDKKKG